MGEFGGGEGKGNGATTTINIARFPSLLSLLITTPDTAPASQQPKVYDKFAQRNPLRLRSIGQRSVYSLRLARLPRPKLHRKHASTSPNPWRLRNFTRIWFPSGRIASREAPRPLLQQMGGYRGQPSRPDSKQTLARSY